MNRLRFEAVILVVIAFVLSSCVTQRRCLEKFPVSVDTVRTVIYRDSIIRVLVPKHDTVMAYSTIRDTLIVHSGSAHGQTWVIHDTLKLNVWQTDTTLQLRIDSLVKEIQVKTTEVVTIRQRTRLEKILWQIIAIAFIIFAGILVTRLFKKK